VRDSGAWEDWLLFMLDGVEQTAGQRQSVKGFGRRPPHA
jgi:hypothetical protein